MMPVSRNGTLVRCQDEAWDEDGRGERKHGVHRHKDDRRGQKRDGVPASTDPPCEQAGEQLAKARLARDKSGHQNAGDSWSTKHGRYRETDLPRELFLCAWEPALRVNDQEENTPGDGERQRVVAQHRVMLDQRRRARHETGVQRWLLRGCIDAHQWLPLLRSHDVSRTRRITTVKGVVCA